MKTAAIVLAAGKGTRMKSARPKVLHAVADHPMIRYPLQALATLGADEYVLVVGHGADDVKSYVASVFAPSTRFAHQPEQRGTGDATRIGLDILGPIEGTILLLPGDTPLIAAESLQNLVSAHSAAGAVVSLVTTRVDNPAGYGRIVRDGDGRIERIVEEADASDDDRKITEINTSVYAFDAAFLRKAIGELQPDNAQGELYLTDVLAMAASQGKHATSVAGEAAEFAGINTRVELGAADRELRRRINEAHMLAGVTIDQPETVRIDPDVVLEPDVHIGPAVTLSGKTSVGGGTRIETGCVVRDTTVGEGVHIKPYCVIGEATIGNNSRLGPFAHLRPGADLAETAHVGNYVEVKKSRIGRGSKVNHLTYIGDAEIGEGVNVGAGTITCNYDGVAKHRTTIKDGAFIGSNTALVAPVTVGRGAVVGAGSAITKDVPDDALGLTRARQSNIAGYAAKRRKKKKE